MRVTRMLVTGYDEDKSMFAVSLAAGSASIVLTNTNEQGETTASVWQETIGTLDALGDLVERIIGAPAPASS